MEQSYKEKYEQALAKAKEQYNYPCMRPCMGILEEIFPELKDSEDEKVRKALLEMVHDTTGDELLVDYNVHKEEALAWLEKQGEKLPAGFYYVNSEGKKFYSEKFKYGNVVLGISANNGKDEQKPTDSYCQENCKGYQETGKCFADGMCNAKREAEQKPEENKGNVGGISANWSKSDEAYVLLLDSICESSEAEYYDHPNSIIRKEIVNARNWLKSLKERIGGKI